MSAWRQFREVGIPRCPSHVCGGRLILPWQGWVCEIEDWPKHHACFHAHLVEMLAWCREQGDTHLDYYDHCRFCGLTTDSGFARPHEPLAAVA